eukprot:6505956-Pyramimonas_sp.AAC.1
MPRTLVRLVDAALSFHSTQSNRRVDAPYSRTMSARCGWIPRPDARWVSVAGALRARTIWPTPTASGTSDRPVLTPVCG